MDGQVRQKNIFFSVRFTDVENKLFLVLGNPLKHFGVKGT